LNKPASFIVEQSLSESWPINGLIPYSKVITNNDWEIDVNGIFTVPKTATYSFTVSGTAGSPSAAISLQQKIGNERKTLEMFFETTTGKQTLIELPTETEFRDSDYNYR
jgi:hypothetical protein